MSVRQTSGRRDTRYSASGSGHLLTHDVRSLDRVLLELHAAQEMKDFWRTARLVLHEALPLHFICLCLRPFVLLPSTVFREKAPFSTEAEFRLFQELNPLHDYIAARPGTRLVRMSDVIVDQELVETEFYRRFMLPQDDRYFACFCFWHAGSFQGMIGLHRTREQRDFTASEMDYLARLHPHFETVLHRILSLHRERAVRLSLERLLTNLPIATILVDWDQRVTYRNHTAVDLCALWNHGPLAARIEKHHDDFRLPSALLDFCEDFKARWKPTHHRVCGLLDPAGTTIRHPSIEGLRGTINLLQLDAAPLSMPVFLIRLEHRTTTDATPAAPGNSEFSCTARLSPREREVAALVGQGCTNDEIARRLGKSVLTVKKQLRSIYKKLEIDHRGRLIALMR